MKEAELLRLKQEVEDSSKEVAKSQGQKEALLKQLKALGYASVKEAEAGIESLQKKKKALQEKFDKTTQEIEEKYGSE